MKPCNLSPVMHCALRMMRYALLLFPLVAQAQVGDPRRDVSVGVSAGYSLSQTSFQPSISQTMKGNMMYGLAIRYNCEKYFKSLCGIQAELNYVCMGWKEEIETSDDTYSRDMNYLQVPILARMGWGYEQKGALFYVVAGPQVGFLLSEKENRGGEFSQTTLGQRPGGVTMQYGKLAEHKFDYGLLGGAGLEINSRHAGHYMIEGRYYLALSDIFKNGKTEDFGRSAHTAIYVKFTYLFDILRTKR